MGGGSLLQILQRKSREGAGIAQRPTEGGGAEAEGATASVEPPPSPVLKRPAGVVRPRPRKSQKVNLENALEEIIAGTVDGEPLPDFEEDPPQNKKGKQVTPKKGEQVTPKSAKGEKANPKTPKGEKVTPKRSKAEEDTPKSPKTEEATPDIVKHKNAEETLVPSAEKTLELNVKEKRAKWASYMRSLNPASERSSRSEKIPDSIALQISSLADQKHWFGVWLQNGCSWGNAMLSETQERNTKNREVGTTAWLVASQIEDLYKSSEICKAIVEKKLTEKDAWRPHPEVPHLRAAIQYKVTVASELIDELERVTSKKLVLQGELDTSSAADGASGVAALAKSFLSESPQESNPSEPRPTPQLALPPPSSANPPADPITEQARLLAEKARIAAEKKAKLVEQRKEETERKKREKEEFDKTPAGQAKSWLVKLEKDIGECSTCLVSTATNPKMPESMKLEWKKTFEEHLHNLKRTREEVEEVRDGRDTDQSTVDNGMRVVKDFKTDVKALNLQQRAYK